MARKNDPHKIPIGDEDAPPPADADALLGRVAELEQRLATAEEIAAKEKVELLRKAADLDNARKRFQREHERACATAAQNVVVKLLPLLADLARAAEAAAADAATPAHVVDAFRGFERRLGDALKSEGLEPIPCKRGDPFEPELHEAVLASCDPALPPQTVATVLEPGYLFQGALLKPVKVEVCVAATEEGA